VFHNAPDARSDRAVAASGFSTNRSSAWLPSGRGARDDPSEVRIVVLRRDADEHRATRAACRVAGATYGRSKDLDRGDVVVAWRHHDIRAGVAKLDPPQGEGDRRRGPAACRLDERDRRVRAAQLRPCPGQMPTPDHDHRALRRSDRREAPQRVLKHRMPAADHRELLRRRPAVERGGEVRETRAVTAREHDRPGMSLWMFSHRWPSRSDHTSKRCTRHVSRGSRVSTEDRGDRTRLARPSAHPMRDPVNNAQADRVTAQVTPRLRGACVADATDRGGHVPRSPRVHAD
jgi:hypothetical protein